MDTNDRKAISELFDKLAKVEKQTPSRDADAEKFIKEAIMRQPGAPYYMAQTVVVQEHALNEAQARIEQLEAEAAQLRQDAQGGGFLSGLFGSGPAPQQPARAPRPMQKGAPGGFLAGGAQTAMGVAGGMLLANALVGTLAGDAEASETLPEDDPDIGDMGIGDDLDF